MSEGEKSEDESSKADADACTCFLRIINDFEDVLTEKEGQNNMSRRLLMRSLKKNKGMLKLMIRKWKLRMGNHVKELN